MATVQLQLTAFIVVGYVLGKLNKLSHSTRKQIADLTMDLFLPATTISSFEMIIDSNDIKTIINILIVSFFIEVLMILFGLVAFRFMKKEHSINCKYATIVSNISYISYPILEALYGNAGVLYASIFLINQRIAMYSYGTYIYDKENKNEFFKKTFLNPCMISLYIGVIVMYFFNKGIYMPEFLSKAIKAIGSCSTIMCMLVVGANIADQKLNELIEFDTIYMSLVRTIVLPIIVSIALSFLPVDSMAKAICVICVAAPCPIASVAMSQKYDLDPIFTSKAVALSTLLSMITTSFIVKFFI